MVLTDEHEQTPYPAATMETAQTTTEELLYANLPQTRTFKNGIPGYPTDNTTTPNDNVAKVSGATGDHKIGPSIVLKVMAGDKFNVKVSSWYRTNGVALQQPVSPLNDLILALANGLSGAVSGATHGAAVTPTDIQNTGLLSPNATQFLSSQPYLSSKPKAYLNWILFDEHFKYVGSSSGAEQVGDNDALTQHLKTDLPIDKNGYLYVYVSNETPNIPVFFDNLQVTHIKGPLTEETHYYPFGGRLAGISSTAANTLNNKNLYNGKEKQDKEFRDGSGLELYDYVARFYDAQIGRWGTIDPHCQNYYSFSPYVYVGNNPALLIDPDGKDWFYHSVDGNAEATWNWHDGSEYHTGVNDAAGNEVVLQGTEAVVVFNGSRDEKLGKKNGKDGYINGDGAITASVTVYGPDGADDVHKYTGYTMGSDADKFGAIDEGTYDANYDAAGKRGKLKSHWTLNQRGHIRMMDGAINPNAPDQVEENGEGYKDGIFIHTSNSNGYAGTYANGTKGISVGCLLIAPSDWASFNEVMSGATNFKVQVIRTVTEKVPLQGIKGAVPNISVTQITTKKD